MSSLDIEDSFGDLSNVSLFSTLYMKEHTDCQLCIFQNLKEYKSQIQRFEEMLVDKKSKLGCGIKTCVNLVLGDLKYDQSMVLFQKLHPNTITEHFDVVFGSPLCGYNRQKQYNFQSLFNQTNVTNNSFVDFVYKTYKFARNTSLCPYSILCVFIYMIMKNTFGGASDFKKKHDYIWMFNSLYCHNIRLGKLQ